MEKLGKLVRAQSRVPRTEDVVNSSLSTCPGPSTDAIMSPPGSSTGPGEVGVLLA